MTTFAVHNATDLRSLLATSCRAVRSRGATRHYRIGPVPLTLTCGIPELADDYHRYYRTYEVHAPAADSFHIEVRTRRSRRSLRKYFHVYANGREQCILQQAKSVLPFIEWTTNALVAKFLPDYLQIHAASMSRDGIGAIIAGEPGQGKSTLAAGLLARGWSYLSDEFAMIDPDTRRLEAFPKALCIKAGSFAPLLELGLPIDLKRVLHKGGKGPVSLLDPLAVREDAVSSPCPVRLIIFPEYQPDVEPSIEPVSRARAVFDLVQVSFNFTKFRGTGLDMLTHIARGASCIRLRTGDLEKSVSLLDEYVADLQAADRRAGKLPEATC